MIGFPFEESPMAAPGADEQVIASTPAPAQAHALFEELYRELHRLAAHQLRRNGPGLTLGATTLLHEAYLNFATTDRGASFPDKGRFFAYAARAMRSLIVDYVRQRRALKRGGAFHLTSLDVEADAVAAPEAEELERVAEALGALEQNDALLAQLVDLKFFCGFSFAEIAAMRGVSERTVQRDWSKARLVLRRHVTDA
jgi:RNA polymerase sigma factor (TIGR02999 family)